MATVPRISGLLLAADCISALTEFDQALTLRQASSLYGGHVCKSWQNIRLESGKEK
jgi:hypothetical protein